MSEYQYYEFQTIDRPLSEKEREIIGRLSSRTTPTANQATFTYSYSDFPGSPEKVVERYFDAMLYIANWGTRQLIFRFPRKLVDIDALRQYCFQDAISVSASKNHVILKLFYDDEEGFDWIEGEGILSSLLPLRNDVLNGDYRMLYLAWLHAIDMAYDIEGQEAEREPPVPPGLKRLSGPLKRFVEFLEIDEDLISAGTQTSTGAGRSKGLNIEKAIGKLPEKERIAFLAQVAQGDAHVNLSLMQRLRELSPVEKTPDRTRGTRIVAELLESKQRKQEQRKKRKQKQRERERIKKLETLAGKEPALWRKVFALIQKKQTSAYDEAVKILLDLRDVADHLDKADRFRTKLDRIRQENSRLSGLKSRLDRAGLKHSSGN